MKMCKPNVMARRRPSGQVNSYDSGSGDESSDSKTTNSCGPVATNSFYGLGRDHFFFDYNVLRPPPQWAAPAHGSRPHDYYVVPPNWGGPSPGPPFSQMGWWQHPSTGEEEDEAEEESYVDLRVRIDHNNIANMTSSSHAKPKEDKKVKKKKKKT